MKKYLFVFLMLMTGNVLARDAPSIARAINAKDIKSLLCVAVNDSAPGEQAEAIELLKRMSKKELMRFPLNDLAKDALIPCPKRERIILRCLLNKYVVIDHSLELLLNNIESCLSKDVINFVRGYGIQNSFPVLFMLYKWALNCHGSSHQDFLSYILELAREAVSTCKNERVFSDAVKLVHWAENGPQKKAWQMYIITSSEHNISFGFTVVPPVGTVTHGSAAEPVAPATQLTKWVAIIKENNLLKVEEFITSEPAMSLHSKTKLLTVAQMFDLTQPGEARWTEILTYLRTVIKVQAESADDVSDISKALRHAKMTLISPDEELQEILATRLAFLRTHSEDK